MNQYLIIDMLQNLSQFVRLFIEMHYVHGESKNLLICSRYELSVKTKKFRIDIKRCNKVLSFKYRLKFVQNDKNCTLLRSMTSALGAPSRQQSQKVIYLNILC
jgi:hypothetical protein